MTLDKLYLTVNFAVPLKLLHDCTAVNSFSILQQFTIKMSERNSVCTVRVLERHTVRKLYRSAKIVSANKAYCKVSIKKFDLQSTETLKRNTSDLNLWSHKSFISKVIHQKSNWGTRYYSWENWSHRVLDEVSPR